MNKNFGWNVIKGPWREPKAGEEKSEDSKMSLEEARAIISRNTGLSESFLILCSTAGNPKPEDIKIFQQKQSIIFWTKAELLAFANDESKHAILLQKPALAIAIYELIMAKR